MGYFKYNAIRTLKTFLKCRRVTQKWALDNFPMFYVIYTEKLKAYFFFSPLATE